MIINFSPVRSDNELVIFKSGELLTVNGTEYDLSQIPEGATLPNPGAPFAGDIERNNGQVELTLILPHGPNPSPEQAFPEPVLNPEDGEVVLP